MNPNDRMAAELTAWLRSLEPAGTPVALRLRTFADLRAETERPRRRLAWLAPMVSGTAQLAAMVGGLALLAALAIGAAAVPATGGPSPIIDLRSGTVSSPSAGMVSYDPAGLVALVIAACLASWLVRARPVRIAATWLVFGRAPQPPAPPLPFRRSLRDIPRLTWFVAGLTVVALGSAISYGLRGASTLPSTDPVEVAAFISYWTLYCLSLFALAVAWRYPHQDRSGRLLILGTTISLWLELLALLAFAFAPAWLLGIPGVMWPFAALGAVATLCLAAGVAARSGALRLPPARLAAISVGLAFGLTMFMTFQAVFTVDPESWLEFFAPDGTQAFLTTIAWLTVAWVALTALLRRRSWPWSLVLVAALLNLCAALLQALLPSVIAVPAVPFSEQDLVVRLEEVAFLARQVLSSLASVAMLAALLGGLRPVGQAPDPGTENPVDAPSESPRMA